MATKKRVESREPKVRDTAKDDSITTKAGRIRSDEIFDSAKYNAMSDMTQSASLDLQKINTSKAKAIETMESRQIDNKSIRVTDMANNSGKMQTAKITPMVVEERARTLRSRHEDVQQSPSGHDRFILYLNIMLSIENAALERLQSRIQQSPLQQARQQFAHHLEETREQKKRLILLIRVLGGHPTDERAELPRCLPPKSLNDALDTLLTAEEQELKTLETDALIEHAEIISYNTLIQMALKMNIGEAIPVLKQNLQEEEEMVVWARTNPPSSFVQLWNKIWS